MVWLLASSYSNLIRKEEPWAHIESSRVMGLSPPGLDLDSRVTDTLDLELNFKL